MYSINTIETNGIELNSCLLKNSPKLHINVILHQEN